MGMGNTRPWLGWYRDLFLWVGGVSVLLKEVDGNGIYNRLFANFGGTISHFSRLSSRITCTSWDNSMERNHFDGSELI